MIRSFQPHDAERVMELWLEGNWDAHPFIPKSYWTSCAPQVRGQLPRAEVYVYESGGKIQGFAGMQGDCLAGIFVDRRHRSAGIGKQLLDHIKKRHPAFTLHVYRRNRRALGFYLREGLSVLGQGVDEDTGEQDMTMKWSGRCEL